MRTIFAEYDPHRNSIDVYTNAGYMLRIDCWEAENLVGEGYYLRALEYFFHFTAIGGFSDCKNSVTAGQESIDGEFVNVNMA